VGKKISVANLVATAGGIVCLLFSFFNFYKFGNDGRTVWSDQGGAWITTIPAILAIALVAWSACELFGVKLPANVLTFNGNQLKATWGISATGLMIDQLVSWPDGLDKGIGFWFMLLGSLAMGAGAVMALLGKGTDLISLGGGPKPAAAPMPPQPYGMAPPPPPGMVPPPPPPPPPPAG